MSVLFNERTLYHCEPEFKKYINEEYSMKKLCRVYSIIITCSIMVLSTEVSIADDVIIPSKMSK